MLFSPSLPICMCQSIVTTRLRRTERHINRSELADRRSLDVCSEFDDQLEIEDAEQIARLAVEIDRQFFGPRSRNMHLISVILLGFSFELGNQKTLNHCSKTPFILMTSL